MAKHLKWQENLEFAVGDTIKVHQTVSEGEKTRTQIFEGIVIAIRGRESGKSYVVRRIASNNVGVEKIFPANSPIVTKIEIVKKGKVRRAKLYYLRARLGKKATKIKDIFVKKIAASVEVPVSAPVVKEEKVEKVAKERPEAPEKAKEIRPTIIEKPKKEKKGKKKIQRKERTFVR